MNSRTNQILAFAGLLLALAAASTASALPGSLLSNHSFETDTDPMPSLAPVVGPPFAAGFWGAESGGSIVGPENGITPSDLNLMHHMEDTGGVATQTFQAYDVSSLATDIDAGNATVSLSGMFNALASGAQGGVYVFFYNSANGWPTSIGQLQDVLTFDGNLATWELSSLNGSIPVSTRWLLIQLAFANSTLQGQPAYVDDVHLNVAVPEPSSLSLLAFGVLLLSRRRTVWAKA